MEQKANNTPKTQEKQATTIDNAQAMEYWKQKADQAKENPLVVKVQACNDYSALDRAFVQQFLQHNTRLLDIGSGTGMLINGLLPYCASITAIEPIAEFAQHIVQDPKLTVIIENILSYTLQESYHVATLFGVMHYVNAQEAEQIYTKVYNALEENGILLIKQQFGVHETVCVHGFSEELQTKYYSEYRSIKEEKALLQKIGFTDCTEEDIYPASANRFTNTHFYAVIARK